VAALHPSPHPAGHPAGFELTLALRKPPDRLPRLSGPVGLHVRRRRNDLVTAGLSLFGLGRLETDLSDGLIFDAVRIRVPEIGEASLDNDHPHNAAVRVRFSVGL
jgi:hypothetical protein